MKWQDHLAKVIVVEEYYIHVETAREGRVQFKIRYIVHNGYTVIETLPDYNRKMSDFEEWFRLRSDLNTRYDSPHWYTPIRWNRKKALTQWALNAIQIAYNQYYQENVDAIRNK